MPDYHQGKIYKLVNDVDNEIYVGSTCNSLPKRLGEHKGKMKHKPNQKIYQKMHALGLAHFRIILVEDYPCNNKNELTAREEHWRTELKASLNMVCCSTGIKCCKIGSAEDEQIEYRRNYEKAYNKTEKRKEFNKKHQREYRKTEKGQAYNKQYRKQYYEDNKEKKISYAQLYRTANREKIREKKNQQIQCVCGLPSTRNNLKTHQKTARHRKALRTQIGQFTGEAKQRIENNRMKHQVNVERFTQLSLQLRKRCRKISRNI